jgi:hypothetical protein
MHDFFAARTMASCDLGVLRSYEFARTRERENMMKHGSPSSSSTQMHIIRDYEKLINAPQKLYLY